MSLLSTSSRAFHAFPKAAALLLLAAAPLLGGCYMTPEDKAFYGRGWINPDELDRDAPPPRSFTDAHSNPPPTVVRPREESSANVPDLEMETPPAGHP
jgi:hypothetical protein